MTTRTFIEELIHNCVAAVFEKKDICRNYRKYTGRRVPRCQCQACQTLFQVMHAEDNTAAGSAT